MNMCEVYPHPGQLGFIMLICVYIESVGLCLPSWLGEQWLNSEYLTCLKYVLRFRYHCITVNKCKCRKTISSLHT